MLLSFLFSYLPDLQLFPGRGSVLLSFKNVFIAAEDDDLGGGINGAAFQQMPAHGFTAAVADADVEMGAVHRDRSGQAQDLEMAAVAAAVGLIGKTDIVICQAADSRTDPTSFNLLFVHKFLYLRLQVLPGFKTESMCMDVLHSLFLLAGE